MSVEPSEIAGLPVSPSGRKLLRLEVRNAETPIERKPPWIKTKLKMGPEYTELKALVKREGLHTVCEEAGCPNIYECWEDREATFLIGGEQCTRRCDFCQIDTGKPAELDRDEPRRVAESVQAMGLRYSTVTGVARDDLPDGGAWLYAETVPPDQGAQPEHRRRTADPRLQRRSPNSSRGLRVAPGSVGAQRRDGAAHLQADPAGVPLPAQPRRDHRRPRLRSGHQVQPDPRHGRDPRGGARPPWSICTRRAATSSPSPSTCGRRLRHHPVERWVKPEEFVEHSKFAEELGFAGVLAGPLVRSSYRAGRLYAAGRANCGCSAHPYPDPMAKTRKPAADKAAKAEAKAARKAAPRSAGASSGRRSRCSARKTSASCRT